jgi:hypothetical protein
MDMFLGGFTTARVGLELSREPLGSEVSFEEVSGNL